MRLSLAAVMVKRMKKITPFLTLSALASGLFIAPAFSQNTTDDWKWVVDHYKNFGIWTSACDHRDLGEGKEERCYVRVVDVYSPRPNFGAAFVFANREKENGVVFEFSFERGTVFTEDGFTVKRGHKVLFTYDAFNRCEGGTNCVLSGPDRMRLVDALNEGGTLRLAFSDRRGMDWVLNWSGEGLAEALADHIVQSDARKL